MNKEYVFIDLEYPNDIDKHHKGFPMAPERCKVTYNQLSPLNQSLYRK